MDFSDAPDDPLERIVWLDELRKDFLDTIDTHLQPAYFECRQQNRLDAAVAMGPHGKKVALAMTRRENEKRGRQIRWKKLL
jgi:hypothetical protein